MINCEPLAGGVRWPKSNWEIPAELSQVTFSDSLSSVSLSLDAPRYHEEAPADGSYVDHGPC